MLRGRESHGFGCLRNISHSFNILLILNNILYVVAQDLTDSQIEIVKDRLAEGAQQRYANALLKIIRTD